MRFPFKGLPPPPRRPQPSLFAPPHTPSTHFIGPQTPPGDVPHPYMPLHAGFGALATERISPDLDNLSSRRSGRTARRIFLQPLPERPLRPSRLIPLVLPRQLRLHRRRPRVQKLPR